MKELTFTAVFPFGGSGAGARGFLDAQVALPDFGVSARFISLGGIDVDPLACADFAYLTGTEELCADVSTLTPADIRRRFGTTAPDCVFLSPPCKGASGLLSAAKSKTAKYEAMNELALVWLRLMLQAWDRPPKLVLLENVPRLKTRAAAMLLEVGRLMRGAGYAARDGFHCCGELGGLGQRRRRYLQVWRHKPSVGPELRHAPKKRVRGCGEILEALPVPATLEAAAWGRMHELPKLSALNWERLRRIPAGGDWRDLDGVLEEGQSKRSKFKRHKVEAFDEPTGTIGGSGSNGVANVADPRAGYVGREANFSVLGVKDWTEPSGAVTGMAAATRGSFSVADPRPSAPSLDDPYFTAEAYDHAYGVLSFDEPSPTVAGGSYPGQGAYSIADLRVGSHPRAGAYGVLRWNAAARVITGSLRIDNGPAAVADPRKPPPFIPVLIAADGTWHRPLTTLELAALQGFPLVVNGKPLVLAGKSHEGWRERIGNAVPPPAARAIAEGMLLTLAADALDTFNPSTEPVWVSPDIEVAHG